MPSGKEYSETQLKGKVLMSGLGTEESGSEVQMAGMRTRDSGGFTLSFGLTDGHSDVMGCIGFTRSATDTF